MKLTFKRMVQPKENWICSGERPFIDFLINGKPLSELLGDVGSNIGKFGWGNSSEAPNRIRYEENEINKLKSNNTSSFENGLYSIYVCAECGDEGCLAVMFKKHPENDKVIWSEFVWSNGEDEIDASHTKIEIEPIIFDTKEYDEALERLKEMIKN